MDLLAPESQKLRTLEPTWAVLDREPGMDDLAEGAAEILKKMGEDLKIYPFQDTDGNDRVFLARFEFPKYEEDFQFPAAAAEDSFGFIDFLAGFPIDCVEMLVVIGEISSKADKISVQPGTGVSPPVPKEGTQGFFKWPEPDKILLNLTAIPTRNVVKWFAQNLSGEPKPAKAHWWLRVQFVGETKKLPVPGEFLGLGVRIFPGKYWGKQKSSPFIYSGNWMDTVYYTGAIITEVVEPTEDSPYPTYKVKWHGQDEEITVNPSDFAEYKVGDRVTVLKDVATEKKSQLWKDDDMKVGCDKTVWQIVPLTFYGLEKES
jgi:hypothetical protein